MAESQDVNVLKRRGRRRLVGAVALVLVAVIVLPMVFDPEPRQSAPPISVRIPDEDDARFTPKLAPQAPVDKAGTPASPAAAQTPLAAPAPDAPKPAAEPTPAAAPQSESRPAASPAVTPKASPTPPPQAAKDAERQRAERALGNGDFVVQVAALGEDEKVKALVERLAAAKLPHYTEPVAIAKGKVTRVRVGPFSSRAAAERAVATLTAMGLKPGGILERP